MMWSVRVRLISSISDASVVVLPEPVGPVKRTRPRGFVANSWRLDGRPSSSRALMSVGIRRNAPAIASRW
jgi:hypothetical protein